MSILFIFEEMISFHDALLMLSIIVVSIDVLLSIKIKYMMYGMVT